jgi:23S rRNA pseudouridine1911/1915/1917 synthase
MSSSTLRLVAARRAQRVDRLICDETGRGRRIVRRWLVEGRVRIDGHVATSGGDPVEPGSRIVIETDERTGEPERVADLRIVLETDEIVVVAKPAGLHSERGRSAGSVAELLEERYGDLSAVGERAAEAGLVHRLDRDTSGALVAARNRATYRKLRDAFAAGRTTKHYLALANGRLDRPREIAMPLVQRGDHVAAVSARDHDDSAIDARTFVEPLDIGPGWSLVLATMHSGAMHQVRCHLAAIGHPLFGDDLYGGDALDGAAREGQLLHALRIRIDGAIDVTIAPPEDFVRAYAGLRRGPG